MKGKSAFCEKAQGANRDYAEYKRPRECSRLTLDRKITRIIFEEQLDADQHRRGDDKDPGRGR